MPPGRQEMVLRAAPVAKRREILESLIDELRRLRIEDPRSGLRKARDTVRLAEIAHEQELYVRAVLELTNFLRIQGRDRPALEACALAERSSSGVSAALRTTVVLCRVSLFNSIGRWRRGIIELSQLGHCGVQEGRRQVMLASGYSEVGAFAESDRATWRALRHADRCEDLELSMVSVHNAILHRLAVGAWSEAETLFDRSEQVYRLVGSQRARIGREQAATCLALFGDDAETGARRVAALRDEHLRYGAARNALHDAVWQIAVACHKGTSDHLQQVLADAARAVEETARPRGLSFQALAARPLSRQDLWQELRRLTRAIGGSTREPLFRSSP